MERTEAPAQWRKPPATATPRSCGHRAHLRLYTHDTNLRRAEGIRTICTIVPLTPQEQLFRLLGASEHIGVHLTEGYMMDLEGSVSALVFHHPDARYFNLAPEDVERLEREIDRVRRPDAGRDASSYQLRPEPS